MADDAPLDQLSIAHALGVGDDVVGLLARAKRVRPSGEDVQLGMGFKVVVLRAETVGAHEVVGVHAGHVAPPCLVEQEVERGDIVVAVL